jgi:hypothetical protein
MPRNSEAVNRAFAELEHPIQFETEERVRALKEINPIPRQQDREPAELLDSPALKSDAARNLEIEQQIRDRAYCLYVERGREDGHEIEDWLEAELELLANR